MVISQQNIFVIFLFFINFSVLSLLVNHIFDFLASINSLFLNFLYSTYQLFLSMPLPLLMFLTHSFFQLFNLQFFILVILHYSLFSLIFLFLLHIQYEFSFRKENINYFCSVSCLTINLTSLNCYLLQTRTAYWLKSTNQMLLPNKFPHLKNRYFPCPDNYKFSSPSHKHFH